MKNMENDKKMLRILIILSLIGFVIFGFILYDYNNTKVINEDLKRENYELKKDNDRLKDDLLNCQVKIPVEYNNEEE